MLKVGLPIALAIIMFGMGLGLTLADFTRVFKKPKAFITGFLLQLVSLPILAYVLISLFSLQGAFAVGFMVLAACPGGVTSNLLTYIGKGDVALSVSLTAVISLLSFLTVPLITGFALVNFMGADAPDLPIAKTIIGILVITIIPLALGMLVRKFKPATADSLEKYFASISFIVFILVVIGALVENSENVIPYLMQAGIVSIVFNLLVMAVAIMLAGIMALPKEQRTAIALECGLQNGTLGLVVALTILGRPDIGMPIAAYSLIMLFIGFAYAMWARSGSGTLKA
jgi:BASS family bile acid:Na+ symporter